MLIETLWKGYVLKAEAMEERRSEEHLAEWTGDGSMSACVGEDGGEYEML